jgi:hypothetical protein
VLGSLSNPSQAKEIYTGLTGKLSIDQKHDLVNSLWGISDAKIIYENYNANGKKLYNVDKLKSFIIGESFKDVKFELTSKIEIVRDQPFGEEVESPIFIEFGETYLEFGLVCTDVKSLPDKLSKPDSSYRYASNFTSTMIAKKFSGYKKIAWYPSAGLTIPTQTVDRNGRDTDSSHSSTWKLTAAITSPYNVYMWFRRNNAVIAYPLAGGDRVEIAYFDFTKAL